MWSTSISCVKSSWNSLYSEILTRFVYDGEGRLVAQVGAGCYKIMIFMTLNDFYFHFVVFLLQGNPLNEK